MMKGYFKTACLCLATLCIILAACACTTNGGNTSYTDPVDKGFNEPELKDITVWSTFANTDLRIFSKANMEGFMDAFSQDHPGYTVEYTTFADNLSSYAQIVAAVQSNTQPDLIYSPFINYFYFENVLQPFDYYIQNDPEYNSMDLHEVINEYTIDGHYYGMIGGMTCYLLAWNKDMFAENGLDPEVPPKTLDEILELQSVFRVLNEKGRVTQCGLATYFGCHQVSYAYTGNRYRNNAGYKYDVDNEWTVKYYEWCVDMAEVMGGISNLTQNMKNSSFLTSPAFQAGEAAMAFVMMPYQWQGVDFKVGLARWPSFADDPDQESIVVYTDDVFQLMRDCKNPDGGWFYVKWYMSAGLLEVAELNSFDADPVNYFPFYYTNSYIRQRCYDLYYDELTEESKALIAARDAMFDNAIANSGCHQARIDSIYTYNEIITVAQQQKVSSIREYLKDLQRRLDALADEWIEEKNQKGWNISDENPWGTPPEL